MNLDWKWLGLQVGLPLAAPILLAGGIAALWLTLNPGFSPDIAVILDLTPWSLVFYSLALIGSAFLARSSANSPQPWLARMLGAVAGADIVYYALMVISRHNPTFAAPEAAYYVSSVLAAASIYLCYRAR